MALEVEDGTGKVNAESYNSVAELDTYFTANGAPTAWATATTADKERHARIATRWQDAQWSWSGVLAHPETPQALAFPRNSLYDREGRAYASTAVPGPIKTLHAEVVRLSVEGKLQTTEIKRGGLVQSVTAGPVSKTYATHADWRSLYPYLDKIAKPMTSAAGGFVLTRG